MFLVIGKQEVGRLRHRGDLRSPRHPEVLAVHRGPVEISDMRALQLHDVQRKDRCIWCLSFVSVALRREPSVSPCLRRRASSGRAANFVDLKRVATTGGFPSSMS